MTGGLEERLLTTVFYASLVCAGRHHLAVCSHQEYQAVLAISRYASRIILSSDAAHLESAITLHIETLASCSDEYDVCSRAMRGEPIPADVEPVRVEDLPIRREHPVDD